MTGGHAELGEFARFGLAEHAVALDRGVGDLADDALVGDAADQAVLGRVVFVLVLSDQLAAGMVVGLALATAAVFGLQTLVVRLVLLHLDETHFFTCVSTQETQNPTDGVGSDCRSQRIPGGLVGRIWNQALGKNVIRGTNL